MVALAGCATVGPDFETPEVDLAERWTETGADGLVEAMPQTPAAWWEVFSDPVLNALVDETSRQNLDLEIAGLRILEARARLGIAVGSQYPQSQDIYGRAIRTGLSENSPNLPPIADTRFWNADLGFDAVWELDFWGRYRRGVEAAQADLAASLAGYDAALVTLTAETARAYLTIRTLQERIAVTQESVTLQRRSQDIARVLYKNGLVTELDFQQATTLLESTSAQVPILEAGLAEALNALSVLLGQAPGGLGARLGDGAVPAAPAEVAVGVPADLLRRRPDVRLAELQAAAQSARVGLAQAEKYPRLGLTGTVGLRASDVGESSVGDLFSSDSVEFLAGPFFTWPILNYGRIDNAVRVQDARLQQALTGYRQTVLRAAEEVETTVSGYLRAREAAEHYRRSVEAAQRSVDLALLQYREGIADYQRVLDTQRQLNFDQQRYVQSRGDIAIGLVLVYKALGGGWEIRRGRPLVDPATLDEMRERTDWGGLLGPGELPEEAELPEPAGERWLPHAPDW
jgi:NodT family efflux transporter outer membrane factor (OMF) lipoprotein